MPMCESLARKMGGLESAEDFFRFFGIDWDEGVVSTCRLHILQRFHDRLARIADWPPDEAGCRAVCAESLAASQRDFVASTPAREKVFRVFQSPPGGPAFVPLDAVRTNGTSR